MRHARLRALCLAGLLAGCTLPAGGGVGVPSAAPSGALPSPVSTPAASVAPVPAKAVITGEVRDEERRLLANARVEARLPNQTQVVGTGLTDGQGVYRLELAPGTYNIRASKTGMTAREQTVELKDALTLHFGQEVPLSTNPYFLSDYPEIERVIVDEKPGGPLTLKLVVSEPLPEASRERLIAYLDFYSATNVPFMRARGGSGLYRSRPELTWDTEGKVLTFAFAGPYLASGATDDVFYSLGFRQNKLDSFNAETEEPNWEDMGITDAGGKALGRGRAAFAFAKPVLERLDPDTFLNKVWGFYLADRAWNLTHQDRFRFRAARDDAGPKLVDLRIEPAQQIGSQVADLVTLTLSEPMQVAKDQSEPEFTRLKTDQRLLIMNKSRFAEATDPVAIDTALRPNRLSFSSSDARVVTLFYPKDTFKDAKWVEVNLDVDFKDPVGNRPDPKASRMAIKI